MKQLVITTSITRRDEDTLGRYFSDVSKLGMISLSEEEALCSRIALGDQAAIDELVMANLRFVISVAKKHYAKGMTLSDLISEGNYGLIKAAKRFDPSKGFRFITYAVWYIRREISRAAEEQRFIHLPMNRVIQMNQYQRTVSQLEQQMTRQPSGQELAEKTGLTAVELTELTAYARVTTSLDRPVSTDAETTLLDTLGNDADGPDERSIQLSVRTEIGEYLDMLPGKERELLNLYFGLNGERARKVAEIAELFGFSVEYTRRLKDRAIRKLTTLPGIGHLRTCFGRS